MTNLRLNRRRFLSTTGAAVAGAGLGALPAPAAAAQPQVLILGAGMAGVAAAYWLRKLGISSLILEARDRAGGRIWTSTRWADAPVDLGATWLNAPDLSPLTPFVNAFNIKTVPTPFFNFQMVRSNGVKLSAQQIAQAIALYGQVELIKNADRTLLQTRGFPDEPLSVEINKILTALNLNPADLQSVQALIASNILRLGADLSQLSLYYYDDAKNELTNGDRAFPKGFQQLVQGLLGNQQVLYSQVVKRITYGAQGVTVLTNQGTFSAKYAIVTVPLGVLKSGNIEFVPALPAWKQGAINRLGFGSADKLYLRFPRAFWDTTVVNFVRTSPQIGQFANWTNYQLVCGQPVFLLIPDGDFAAQLENLSDAEVVQQLMAVLRQWYGGQGIQVPDPVDFQRSRWTADPFALGCGSYIPVGATGADSDVLALPVPYAANLPASANRLFFAGEATDRPRTFSVWGAYDSGRREALRIQTQLTTK